MENLDAARFLIGGALLTYASAKDLRTRRVANPTWVIGAAAGALFLLGDVLLFDRAVSWLQLALIPVIALVAYGLWYVHLIAGGADAKAIMMLALLVPLPLAWNVAGRELPLWGASLFPPAFVIFANSLIVFLLIPLAFLTYNLARGDIRFPAMMLGYRLDLDAAARRFVWVTETIDPATGRRRQLLMASKQSREEQETNLAGLRAAGVDRVWVTPKIPFMVPLLGGFLVAFLFGDVLTQVILLVLVPTA